MRRILLLCCFCIAQTAFLQAEPLVLEKGGNVLTPKTLEVGLADIAYQVDETQLTDAAGTVVYKLTNTALVTPLYARYAFTPKIESFLKIPYSSLNSKGEPTGAASTTTSDSGLADAALGGKYSFMCKGWDMSGALAMSIPMGKTSTSMPSSFKQGFNVKPLIADFFCCGN